MDVMFCCTGATVEVMFYRTVTKLLTNKNLTSLTSKVLSCSNFSSISCCSSALLKKPEVIVKAQVTAYHSVPPHFMLRKLCRFVCLSSLKNNERFSSKIYHLMRLKTVNIQCISLSLRFLAFCQKHDALQKTIVLLHLCFFTCFCKPDTLQVLLYATLYLHRSPVRVLDRIYLRSSSKKITLLTATMDFILGCSAFRAKNTVAQHQDLFNCALLQWSK